MKIWHVQFNCGDYYCDGMHTVGIFSSKEIAEASIEPYKEKWHQETGALMKYLNEYEYKISERELDLIEKYGE